MQSISRCKDKDRRGIQKNELRYHNVIKNMVCVARDGEHTDGLNCMEAITS